MLSPETFTNFLRDLQQLDRGGHRNDQGTGLQGSTILDAFLQHTPFDSGVLYLRDAREPLFRLAARQGNDSYPESLEAEVPADILFCGLDAETLLGSSLIRDLVPAPHALIPLSHAREHYGLLALRHSDDRDLANLDRDLLRTVSSYVGALLGNRRLASEIREGNFQLKFRLLELEALYDIGLSIASTLDLDQLADEILVRTISLLNARRAALFLRKGERFELHRAFGEVRPEFLDEELGAASATLLLEEGRNLEGVFPGCGSFIAMPIRSNTEVIGVLAAADRELRDGVGNFEPNDLRMLSLFANQAAIALENARLHREALEKQAMERELELAATIQRDILPRSIPEIEGYEIAAFSRPAKQLGGDYHAFFERDGSLSICVADVSGKSIPAAVLVSALHAALQLLFDEGRDLAEIATELNRHIHHWSSENKFITMILATVDRDLETLRYVNAGHNPGYVVELEGLSKLVSHGLPIGIMPNSRYIAQTRSFLPGSVLLAYSDGITEAESTTDEEFDYERLESVLAEERGNSPARIRDAIAAAVDAFTVGAPQKDDQTMVLVRTSQ